ncbi:phage tail protein [Streptomyces liliifuscus]|uniref:Phage tail protein n=1 Tax=Streptomyces liliifuscus TaxID=2797636 RepID=A0A7T7L199_9ACTN|nr:phage tail protein [Streptomyces liliifuscus]QQM44584.1 phage tail protein [Streptomyces liliifuscus]
MPEPYRANEFVVEIGTVESPSVSKVSGLSLGETDVIEIPEGGSNVVRKVSSGVVKFQPLTIERYVDGSADDRLFKEFFEDMFKHGQGGRGSTVRRDGAIVKKHFGSEVFRIMFYGAWVKSASFTDLEAGSTNALKHIVVMEVDGLEWLLT